MLDIEELKTKIAIEGLHNEAITLCQKISDVTRSMLTSSVQYRHYTKYIKVVSLHLKDIKVISDELAKIPIKKN